MQYQPGAGSYTATLWRSFLDFFSFGWLGLGFGVSGVVIDYLLTRT